MLDESKDWGLVRTGLNSRAEIRPFYLWLALSEDFCRDSPGPGVHEAVARRHWGFSRLRGQRQRLQVGLLTPFLAFLVAAGMVAISSSSTIAHGGGTPQLTDAEAGPYRIFAWTEPEPWRAGEVHVSVMVTLAPLQGIEEDERAAAGRLDEPVNDAEVAVTFVPLDGAGEAETVPAESQALGANISYEVDAELPAAGTWQVAIAARGGEGAGDARFEVEVLPARTINLWLLVGGSLLVLALLGMIGIRRRRVDSQ